MKLKVLFVAAFLVVMISCNNNDDDNPGETMLLTVTVDASYSNDSDDWIIVHNEDGSLLATESIEPNQQLQVITNKRVSGKILITHLSYTSYDDGSKWYYAYSYANIEKGKELILKGRPALPEETGKINISVSDMFVAPEFSWFGCPVTPSSSGSWSGSTNTYSQTSSTYAGHSKYLLTLSDGNTYKFKMLSNVQPNDSYSFSFNDMNPADQKVTLTFPLANYASMEITGSEPNTPSPFPFELMWRYINKATTSVEFQYVNSLTNYTTELSLGYSGYSYYYTNRGSIPVNNVEWPQKSDFNITDKSFTNFSATSSKPYVWRKSWWGYNDAASKTHVSWSVSATSDHHSIKELPSEITSAHPVLKTLNYSGTSFYTTSPAYESIVDRDFGTGAEPAGLELAIGF